MYQDRIKESGDSKRAARQHVGELLGINQATLRNWVEDRYGVIGPAVNASAGDKDVELAGCGRRIPNCVGPMRFEDSVGVFRRGGGRPPTSVIVDYIDAHRDRFGVDPICTVLSEHAVPIAPSTYYAAKARGSVSAAALAEAYSANTVHQLFVANRGLYGVRKMWHAMKYAGIAGPLAFRPSDCTTPATPRRRGCSIAAPPYLRRPNGSATTLRVYGHVYDEALATAGDIMLGGTSTATGRLTRTHTAERIPLVRSWHIGGS
jgi:hypothetical protein